MRWWPTLEVVPAWEQTVVQHCRQRSGAYVVWPLAAIVLPNRHGARTSFGALRGVLSMNLMATEEELKAEIARFRAENQALQRPARGQMSLKVSRERCAFRIRARTSSSHTLSRAVGKALGHGR